MDIVRMTRLHLISSIFSLSIERMDSFAFKDKNIRPHLDLLLRLFALNQLKDDHHDLLTTGYFTKKHTKLLREAFNKLLVDLRPHVIPIVESVPSLDMNLVSTIGNPQGDIYEAAFDNARKSNLNKS